MEAGLMKEVCINNEMDGHVSLKN